jgi:hypothetical protein
MRVQEVQPEHAMHLRQQQARALLVSAAVARARQMLLLVVVAVPLHHDQERVVHGAVMLKTR